MIVFSSVAELFFSHGGGPKLVALRLFRFVRLTKIVRFVPAMQKQLAVMAATASHVATFFLLLGFFLFIASLLGMSLFGCKFCEKAESVQFFPELAAQINNSGVGSCNLAVVDNKTDLPLVIAGAHDKNLVVYGCAIANFDSPLQAIFTVLQVFTQDDWGEVMQDGMYFTTNVAGIYFVSIVTIGNYIIFNLLVAILVEGFGSISKKNQSDDYRKSLAKKIGWKHYQRSATTDEEAQNDVEVKNFKTKLGKLGICLKQLFFTDNDTSLYIFSKNNKFRIWLKTLFRSENFEKLMMLVIFGSCSVIVIERPSIPEASLERKIILWANLFFAILFFLEAVFKIIAFGFIFGRKAYLHDFWNCTDFFLLGICITDVAVDFADPTSDVAMVRALRSIKLLKSLRPLRIVSRAQGIQIVIQTLMVSVKPIGNIGKSLPYFSLFFVFY